MGKENIVKKDLKQVEKDYKKDVTFLKKYFVIGAVILVALVFFVLWATGVFGICGDFYCTAKECNSGCGDCGPSSCVDLTCQPQVGENCNNTQDCSCEINQVCGVGRNGDDAKGCYDMKCGDGFCDAKGENKENCCLDCGCSPGYKCNREKAECQFQTPELDIVVKSVIEKVSAASIYSNHELIDDQGKKHPLVSLRIANNGPNVAKKVVISLQIGTYTFMDKEELGDLEPNQFKDYDWYPTAMENILTIKDNMNVMVNAVASFEDEHGTRYNSAKSIPLGLLGKSNWGTYSSVSQYVTPVETVVRQAVSASGSFSTRDDAGIQQAAEQIWNFLSNLGIQYISDPTLEYRQYPAEVLKTKKGDCDDLATLYAGLLESIGIKTALIHHPGHMYAAYYDSQYIYPVETTMLGSSFDDAWDAGNKEYDEHKADRKIVVIEDEWKAKNIKTPGDVGVTTTDVSFPNIEVHISASSEWQCDSQGQWGCQHYALAVFCDLTFANSGTGEGQKCADIYTYVNDQLVQTKVSCQTISANDEQEERISYINHNQPNAAYTYRCEIR